jgi:hypothetical protein
MEKKENQSVFRIRIGSGFDQVSGSGSGSRRAKMTHKNRKNSKKLRNFMFGVLDVFLRAKGFSCSLDVHCPLHGGLGIAISYQKNIRFFSGNFLSSIFGP